MRRIFWIKKFKSWRKMWLMLENLRLLRDMKWKLITGGKSPNYRSILFRFFNLLCYILVHFYGLNWKWKIKVENMRFFCYSCPTLRYIRSWRREWSKWKIFVGMWMRWNYMLKWISIKTEIVTMLLLNWYDIERF